MTAALVIGGMWFVLDRRAERDEERVRAQAEVFERVLAGKDADLAAAAERNRAITAELSAARTREGELDARVVRLAARVEALVAECAGLRASQADFDELKADRARAAGDVGRLEDELANARRELRKAREDLAAALEKPPEEAAPAEPEPEPVPAGAVTDARELERVRTVLNGLLAGSGDVRFVKIGGLRGKTLYGVEISEGVVGVRGTKTFEAREARIAIDAAGKRVEIRLVDGTITYSDSRARFRGDRYVLSLTDVATETWVRSGLTIFGTI